MSNSLIVYCNLHLNSWFWDLLVNHVAYLYWYSSKFNLPLRELKITVGIAFSFVSLSHLVILIFSENPNTTAVYKVKLFLPYMRVNSSIRLVTFSPKSVKISGLCVVSTAFSHVNIDMFGIKFFRIWYWTW